MNRRSFLQWLGGTAAGAAASHVLDVERLLWIPGERTIFLPPHTNGAGLMFHKDAFAFVMADLPLPSNSWHCTTIRFITQYGHHA